MDMERWRKLSPLLDAMLELDPVTRARSMATMRTVTTAITTDTTTAIGPAPVAGTATRTPTAAEPPPENPLRLGNSAPPAPSDMA